MAFDQGGNQTHLYRQYLPTRWVLNHFSFDFNFMCQWLEFNVREQNAETELNVLTRYFNSPFQWNNFQILLYNLHFLHFLTYFFLRLSFPFSSGLFPVLIEIQWLWWCRITTIAFLWLVHYPFSKVQTQVSSTSSLVYFW